MQQLDDLMNALAKARDVERAALMDVNDRERDMELAGKRVERARACANVASAQADGIRRRIDLLIDLRSDSDLDATPDYKPSVPCENLGQFQHYGLLEGPGE